MTLPPHDQTDAQIDSVLRALGTVEAASDLPERLLAQLALRAESPVKNRTSWWRSLTLTQPIMVLTATALLVASLVGLRYLLPHGNAHNTGASPSPSTLASSQPLPERGQATASLSEAHRSSLSGSQSLIAQQDPRAGNQTAPRVDTPRFFVQLVASAPASQNDLPATQASLDAQALEDLHTPSQPAPQEATTGQERLVRLMLRQGEKHDLAQLDPAEQSAFAQRQTREFNTFFNPLRPPLVTALANRVHAPSAVSLSEVREIEAGQRTAEPPSIPPPPSGDSK